MKSIVSLGLGLLLLINPAIQARDSHELDTHSLIRDYSSKLISKGIVIPWAMVQLPNGDIVVSEKQGALKIIREGRLLTETLSGLPKITSHGQGGLLDIALHPRYSENKWLYFTYSTENEHGLNTAIMRAKLDSKSLALTEQQLLYAANNQTKGSRHFGSRIAFDNQGFVYFSIGDRGQRSINPQAIGKDGGKIYRLFDDGRIPQDNPFSMLSDAKKAIFSYGHRNPQGLVFDFESNRLWSHEHGPRGGDEVNLIIKGKNYGWPVISYGINYDGSTLTELTQKKGMEQPAMYWDPSIAPSALIKVTSDKYPKLKGKFLLGSLKFGYLVALEVDGDKVVKQFQLMKGLGRVRSLMQGNDGYIYIGLDGSGIRQLVQVQEK